MPLYMVERAHRGRYGYQRKGQLVTLPESYAKDLMRGGAPRVRPATPEEAKGFTPGALPGAVPAAEAGADVGESMAGGTSVGRPAAGSKRPLSSRQLGRRSRTKI